MKLAGAFSLACVALFFAISSWVSLPSYTPLIKQDRARLHDAIFKREAFSLDVPLVLTWWKAGQPIKRIEAKSLEDALEKFPDAVNAALEQAIDEAREMRREAASRIVVPEVGAGVGPGQAPGGGKIKFP